MIRTPFLFRSSTLLRVLTYTPSIPTPFRCCVIPTRFVYIHIHAIICIIRCRARQCCQNPKMQSHTRLHIASSFNHSQSLSTATAPPSSYAAAATFIPRFTRTMQEALRTFPSRYPKIPSLTPLAIARQHTNPPMSVGTSTARGRKSFEIRIRTLICYGYLNPLSKTIFPILLLAIYAYSRIWLLPPTDES